MNRRAHLGMIVLLAVALLAACAEETPAPIGDPPILTGLDPLPKEIATIALSPTATPVMAGGQPVDVM
ncbi:MAG: hypothetical protein JW910_02320, partial [Anaerolineae bacterium]|nr:hypothetical protein [Anaerolineae bacterium]